MVEIHGYPPDSYGYVTARRLSNMHRRGILNEPSFFATDLKSPTGEMRWENWALITGPPNVLYFEDIDGDVLSGLGNLFGTN